MKVISCGIQYRVYHFCIQQMNTDTTQADRVLSLIRDREREHIEFKRLVPSAYKMAKEMAAMANTAGGNILIGVDDDGAIAGVTDEQRETAAVFRAARDLCSPPLEPRVQAVFISGKTVLWVRIAAGTERHCIIDACGSRRCYVRVRDKNLPASKQTARRIAAVPARKLSAKHLDRQELALLEYLRRHEKITLAQFCHATNISKRRASRICVKLEQSGFIRSHDFERELFYTRNPQKY
jgi:predicted HTH transcriptional regulator